MYINGHLALPHCIHLINLKFVRSKKNCDQKNSQLVYLIFYFNSFFLNTFEVLKHLTEASP